MRRGEKPTTLGNEFTSLRAHWLRAQAIVLLLGLLLCRVVLALPSHYSVSQLYHSQWTVRDGAPTGVEMMAQTSDGFLWLGNAAGLVRFDGVQFEKISEVGDVSLLSQSVYTLYATPDGDLWIGYLYGGVSVLRNGHLTNYSQAQGLPVGAVTALAKTPDGTVWAGTARGLFRLEHGQWRSASKSWNVPLLYVDALLVDREQVLWLLEGEQVFYLRPGAPRFEKLPVDVRGIETGMILLDQDGDAAFCAYERFGVLKLQAPSDNRAFVPQWNHRRGAPAAYSKCAFDREGHMWVGGAGVAGRFSSLRETTSSATEELQRYKSDLAQITGDSVSHILEDREGNIWVATSGGLDSFRAPALLKVTLDSGSEQYLLAPAGERGMWVGTGLGKIYRFNHGERQHIERKDASNYSVDTFYGDRSGALWVGGGDAIWRLQPDNQWLTSVRRPAIDTGTRFWNIHSMTQDARGAMWVSVRRVGVYRVNIDQGADGWVLWGGRTDLPAQHANVLLTDARGRIWFGYVDATVAVLDGDRVTTLAGTNQTSLGAVLCFAQRRDLIWIGSDRGLWFSDGKRIQSVTGSQGSFRGVSGIAATSDGDLWLSTADGVIRIPDRELAQAINRSDVRVHYERLNYLDGLPGIPRPGMSRPTAAASSDGRIWFLTDNGVAWTDPSLTPRNAIVPTVVVKSVVADGVSHVIASGAPTQLPVHTHNLQISYTAPSLTMPERVMFRYRLSGDDAEWQDVGTRREAYFTDLPPGRYDFQVIAANNDGLWNETGARVAFVIPPTFVQTRWFTALCVTAAAVAMWLVYLLRLRSVKAQLRLRLEERLVERERIARELHDTFLQSVQGVILRFQSAMERIPPHEPSRALLEDALDRADQVISDGRDAVTNLRATTGASIDLAHELKQLGEHLSHDLATSFIMNVDGKPIELDPVVRQECQRIASEALNNAFHHSRGTRVELNIGYTRRKFSLRVADNGRGFDPKQTYEGHWGLVGMRERADRLHARLLIDSTQAGSTVTLEVAARIAYKLGRRSTH